MSINPEVQAMYDALVSKKNNDEPLTFGEAAYWMLAITARNGDNKAFEKGIRRQHPSVLSAARDAANTPEQLDQYAKNISLNMSTSDVKARVLYTFHGAVSENQKAVVDALTKNTTLMADQTEQAVEILRNKSELAQVNSPRLGQKILDMIDQNSHDLSTRFAAQQRLNAVRQAKSLYATPDFIYEY